MPRGYHYWVYILVSWFRVLYIGVTSDIEEYTWVVDAIAREKQLKRWWRDKKVALIESQNSEWMDLSMDW